MNDLYVNKTISIKAKHASYINSLDDFNFSKWVRERLDEIMKEDDADGSE